MRRGNIVGIAPNPSRRIVDRGLLGLAAVILALFAALLLAGSARADEAPQSETPTQEAPQTEVPGQEAPEEPAPEEPAPEEPAPEAEPPTEPPPAPEVPAEQPEAPAEPPPQPETPAPEAPPAEAHAEGAPQAPPPNLSGETLDNAHSGQTTEEGLGGAASSSSDGSATQAPQDGAPHSEAAVAAEVPSDVIGSLTGAINGMSAAVLATIGPNAISLGQPAEASATLRNWEFRCELSAVGGLTSDNCSLGWMGAQRFLSGTPASLAAAAASWEAAVTAGASADGSGHPRSVNGSTPASPAPSPVPGGASSSTMGAAGMGFSTFFTLAGLRLPGPLRAIRRLRLSSEPWLTACFVLIPERPG